MVGLALVVFVVIFAAGIRASVDSVIDAQVRADLVVVNQDGFSPIPVAVTPRLAAIPGVTTVSALRFAQGRVAGVPGETAVSRVDPRTVSAVLDLAWQRGSPATLRRLGRATRSSTPAGPPITACTWAARVDVLRAVTTE
jgi:putative ABC transport system permease protein